ncbi:hypothetical protein AMS59_09715 [Lysinibacillus sp. FJAT-14745]|nr:hypothetical protein AMS59_09715 [Lysinibacillus sp. FJAT-14745]
MPKTFLLLISMLLLVVGCQEKQTMKPTLSSCATEKLYCLNFLFQNPTFTVGESIRITAKLTFVGQAQNVTILTLYRKWECRFLYRRPS